MSDRYYSAEVTEAIARERDALLKERDRLREALERLTSILERNRRDFDIVGLHHDRYTLLIDSRNGDPVKQARAALENTGGQDE